MTTAVLSMPFPSTQISTSKMGAISGKQAKGNEGSFPFAPVLKGALNPASATNGSEEMDIGKLLQKLKQLLQGVQASNGKPQADQMDKAISLLKKIILALQQKQGTSTALPTVSPTDSVPPGDKKAENVRYSIQLLGWFEQQIHNMLVPSGEQPRSSEQMTPKQLLGALKNTVNRLMEEFAKDSLPIQSDTLPPTKQSRQVDGSGQVQTSSRQTQSSGKMQASGQKASNANGQAQAAFGKTGFTQATVNHPKDIATSVFRRSVLSQGENGQQMSQSSASFADFQSGPMSRLQQMVLHGRQSGGTAEQQQFVRDFQQVLAKSAFRNIGGRQQLTMQLYPRHLGTLNVQLTHENGQLTATLMTSTMAAKNLVDSQLHQLRGAFIGQNLHIDKLQVMMPPGQQQTDQAHDHGESQEDTRDHQEDRKKHMDEDDETETSFTEWLEQIHLI